MNALATHTQNRSNVPETLGQTAVEESSRDLAPHCLRMVLSPCGQLICVVYSLEELLDALRPLDRRRLVEGRG